MRKTLVTIAVLLFSLSAAAELPGQPLQQQGARLSQEALKLFKAGEYRQAIELFGQSNTLSEHRSNWYFIGEAYRRLGLRRKSHEAYSQYAALLSPDEKAAFMPKLATLRWESPCTVSIVTLPGDAIVQVDGIPRGKTPDNGSPLVLSVDGGKHRVTIQLSEHASISDEIDATFGDPIALKYALTPTPNVQTPEKAQHTTEPQHGAKTTKPTQQKRTLVERDDVAPTTRKMRSRQWPNRHRGFFAELGGGTSIWRIDGHDLDSATHLEMTGGGGYTWGISRRFGFQLHGLATYAPIPDSAASNAALWTLLAGVGIHWQLIDRVALQARLGAGLALLSSADNTSAFFNGALDVSGAFPLFALRPALHVTVQIWRGLFVQLTPLAVTYCPRHRDFNPEIGAITRFHFGIGIGWQQAS